MLPTRRTHHLHPGRWSSEQARYFVTICTAQRQPGLTHPALAPILHQAWDALAENGDVAILCRTIMPDHLHLLFRLGPRLSVGQVVGKFKTGVWSAMQARGLAWQRDFYEHRLRPEDAQEGVGWYIFLNPYRKSLAGLDESWPWWRLDEPTAFVFPSQLRPGGCPPPEWLGQVAAWRAGQRWLRQPKPPAGRRAKL